MTPEPKAKPFPWRCPSCRKKTVDLAIEPYSVTAKYEGREYRVEIRRFRVPKCTACGELLIDTHADEQIADALRQQLGLLAPALIHNGREALSLTQKDLAEHLGVAPETICRWESGTLIQSRAMDRLLRLFFGLPDVRAALSDERRRSELGTSVVTHH